MSNTELVNYVKKAKPGRVIIDATRSAQANPLFSRLKDEGFSDNILAALNCVTKKDGENYDAFIQRISVNPLAVKVKLADLEDNMDLSRLPEITDKDRERLKKYQKAKEFLNSCA